MADLSIRIGDIHLRAWWAAAAPRTVEAVRRLLPLHATLVHVRWSGEATWIPGGDLRLGWEGAQEIEIVDRGVAPRP